MKLEELEFETSFNLPVPRILHRVQRIRSRSGTLAIGPLRLPPRGQLRNRFDLPDDDVGYFADGGETAVYETLAGAEQLSTLRLVGRFRLVHADTGDLHRAVVEAIRGSKVVLTA